ncbi:LysR family transcriptional regulator [Roseibacillus ishigakijimensis]|uniref:LysR family transcriptional regulator n=1 Tax=Roseibacillus ishigakijimensis TaxID=454146 RepID=A0A934RJV8_9BACT|nr:LysR family transcriptional regulator [Roseibacillus ishigakijimensis]MBK1832769.1 LysR family transcriptional regulator [Roseibacillus ishigakijimensis]
MKGVTLARLAVLESLSESVSLNQAAGNAVRQSQFSHQIKLLEKATGLVLVERVGRRLRLSRKGYEVLGRYQKLMREIQGESIEGDCEEVTIAGGEMALVQFVIPALAPCLLPDFPAMRLRNMRSAEAMQEFRRGVVDIVLSSSEPPKEVGQRSLRLHQGDFLALTRRKYPAAKRVMVSTILKERLILLEGVTPLRMALEQAAERQGVRLQIAALCSTYEQALALAAQSSFMAVVPGLCRPLAKDNGLGIRKLAGDDLPDSEIWLMHREQPGAGAQQVLRALRVGLGPCAGRRGDD